MVNGWVSNDELWVGGGVAAGSVGLERGGGGGGVGAMGI